MHINDSATPRLTPVVPTASYTDGDIYIVQPDQGLHVCPLRDLRNPEHGAGTAQTYYYITNLQGDVMYLVSASGTKVATYSYDPYGAVPFAGAADILGSAVHPLGAVAAIAVEATFDYINYRVGRVIEKN